MPGRIHEEDVAAVRERARIDEIVGAYVQLKNAGGGTLKGLCPFHSEKTPSFQVTPARGFYHCFGCGKGGDVLSFMQEISNLSFPEAVEQLADKVGIVLRYVEEDGSTHRAPAGERSRLLAANAAAAEFFEAALVTPEAVPGRQLLDGRGFDREAAAHFGVGWAPRGGRELTHFLQQKGFREEELVKAGLTRTGGWDFFQGRILWPIRDSGKQVLGFGARRIFDDDRMPSKYINTPETSVYKKSHVLYGLDLARSAIGKKEQAVVVEGYTDVMAAHLSGVDTAVASCGTAFGEEHARMLHRLVGGDAGRGEIIFTFDGDAAGQSAALKVFGLDRTFGGQTYVAVEESGLDPCDLRMQHGEAAVRELVGKRVPLYRFVMRNVLAKHDLDRADGRLAALREASPLVSSIRDVSLQSGFARELAGMLGMPEQEVLVQVRQSARRAPAEPTSVVVPGEVDADQPTLEAFSQPSPRDRALAVERDTSKLLLQCPELFTGDWNGITERDFSHPGYAAVFRAVVATAAGDLDGDFAQRVRAAADSDAAATLVVSLAVEPLLRDDPDTRYVDEYAAKLQLLRCTFDVTTLKGKLQRTNPIDEAKAYGAKFEELVGMEKRRKELQQRSWGG